MQARGRGSQALTESRRQALRRTQRAHVRVVCHAHDITNTERRCRSTRLEASALATVSAASFIRETHSRGKATIATARIRAKVWQRAARAKITLTAASKRVNLRTAGAGACKQQARRASRLEV